MQGNFPTLDLELTNNKFVHADANIVCKKPFQIFSLWAVSSRKFRGLSFTSQDVGTVLAFSGIRYFFPSFKLINIEHEKQNSL